MVSDHDFYITFSSNTSLLIKIGIITINTFLPTRYKFAYTCSIKINALRFGKLLECIFWILLVVEAFSLQKVVEMHEELVASWQEVRWIWWMRQNFIANLFNLKKNNIYLFIWLPWVLVAAHKIFSCGMWDLVPWPWIEPRPPALGVWNLNPWSTREALFNFWSIDCAVSGLALSWRTGPFLLTNASFRHGSCWYISSVYWAYFSDVVISVGFRKLDQQQTTKQQPWPFFGAHLALRSAL